MNEVFQREIKELFNKRLKKTEVEKIKKAILSGKPEEADILFKYSSVTPEEYKKIKSE